MGKREEGRSLCYRKSHQPVSFFIKQVALPGEKWLPCNIIGVLQIVTGH